MPRLLQLFRRLKFIIEHPDFVRASCPISKNMQQNLKVSDVSTNETLNFVLEHLPNKSDRILEIGCGNGELAIALQNVGFQVVAIDNSVEAVENTKSLGIDARVAEFPDFNETVFDAILFTRSLHHIYELTQSIEKTHQLLNPNGLVIVEDFAFNNASETTIEWLYGIVSLLAVSEQLNLTEDNFAKDLLLGNGDYEVWRKNHHHDLHSAPTMFRELRKRFDPVLETAAPYLYRYFCLLLNRNPNGLAIASQVLELEKRMGKLGKIDLIGRRFVGKRF